MSKAIESFTEMDLKLEFGTALCYAPVFTINGVNAEWCDFGHKFDRSPETAEDYSCGNMRFTRIRATKDVLAKYGITKAQYAEIAGKLEQGLSFGACGWCS